MSLSPEGESGGRWEDEHARRRHDAYARAAAMHERAALCHELAAGLFDQHEKPALAVRERDLATAERSAAAADHDRARATCSQ